MAPDDLHAACADIILANTYHLHIRPGDERIARRGGLHRFAAWDRPILTDSGGYQAFSLSPLRKIGEEGIVFRSHLDGARLVFTPESVVAIQRNLGSDIMMPLDECVPYGTDRDYTATSIRRTTRWALRSREEYPAHMARRPDGGHLLFAITQGGFFPDLRAESIAELAEGDFDGFAIGGLSVGEPKDEMYSLLAASAPLLPPTKPRYLMGVGTPHDMITGISIGVDMFDCVLPTRNARNGTLYTSLGKVNIKRAEFAEDDNALDPACSCYTCRTFSRAYLRHLYVSQELLSFRLNSLHNLSYFLGLARLARTAIRNGTLTELRREMAKLYPDEAACL